MEINIGFIFMLLNIILMVGLLLMLLLFNYDECKLFLKEKDNMILSLLDEIIL